MKYNILTTITAAGFCSLLVIGAASVPAYAEGLAIGAKASTQGTGVEVTASLSKRLNLRVGAQYFKFNRTFTKNGNSYNGKLKLKSFDALADWYIFGGSFRITGGAVVDRNTLDGIAAQSNSYNIGSQTFTSAEVGTLTGNIRFRKLSPYLGIGWGNPVAGDSNWTFMVDLGVIFTGTAKVSLSSSGGTFSNNPILLANIIKEENNIQNTLKFFKYYPVVSLGLAYKF